MPSQAIYARISDEVKSGVDAYASERALTASASVAELLAIGLEAVSNAEVDEARREEVVQLRQQNTELGAQVARSQAVYESLQPRLQQRLGHCPSAGCDHDLTAADILINARCPACGEGVGNLISSPSKDGPSQADLLVLVGAVGAALGLAYLLSQSQ